jgi:hypothetical protein
MRILLSDIEMASCTVNDTADLQDAKMLLEGLDG